MSTLEGSLPATAAELMSAVRRLSLDERREFERQFSSWQHETELDHGDDLLVAAVCENSCLPTADQGRYQELRDRMEQEVITPQELQEYQELLRQLEERNVRRLEALSELARRRGISLPAVMEQLGLDPHDNAV